MFNKTLFELNLGPTLITCQSRQNSMALLRKTELVMNTFHEKRQNKEVIDTERFRKYIELCCFYGVGRLNCWTTFGFS